MASRGWPVSDKADDGGHSMQTQWKRVNSKLPANASPAASGVHNVKPARNAQPGPGNPLGQGHRQNTRPAASNQNYHRRSMVGRAGNSQMARAGESNMHPGPGIQPAGNAPQNHDHAAASDPQGHGPNPTQQLVAKEHFTQQPGKPAAPGSRLTAAALQTTTQRAHEDFVRSQFERGPKDLGRYPTPRPNKHYTQSVPSLPSMTTINFSDDGAVSRVAVGSSDIRNSIAPKHSIQDYGDSWVRHNWDNPNGRDNDEIFHSSDYLSQVIPDWMKRIPDEAVATFLDEGTPMHWKCDVNTETGSLLPAIQYPETQMDLTATEPQLIWRQQNWTATLVINREVHKMQQRNRQQGAAGPSTTPAHDPVAASDEEDDQTPWARKNTKPQVKETPTSPFSPSIACYLRPAEKGDMGQVATIYNSEVSNGLQTLDSAPLSVEDFEKILATAQQLGMPFLVAVAGSARQMTLPYGCATLSVYAQPAPSNAEQGGVDYSAYPQYSSDNTNPPELHKSVLGFAYLSVWEPGLAGSGNGSSRGTARVNLFVHAEHRRKKIGFSLLDKLLTAVSSRFMSETAYDFVDLTKNPTYKNPKDHARKYFRLYLNYFVKHKLPALHKPELAKEQESYDDDLVWVREMLKRFCFEEKVRFESVHRTPKGRSSVFWLDSVVFEHTCHMVQP